MKIGHNEVRPDEAFLGCAVLSTSLVVSCSPARPATALPPPRTPAPSPANGAASDSAAAPPTTGGLGLPAGAACSAAEDCAPGSGAGGRAACVLESVATPQDWYCQAQRRVGAGEPCLGTLALAQGALYLAAAYVPQGKVLELSYCSSEEGLRCTASGDGSPGVCVRKVETR